MSRGDPTQPRWSVEIALAVAPVLVVVAALPIARATIPLATYLPIHTVSELFAIVVSILVFASAWSAPPEKRPGKVGVVAAAFLAVGLLDLGHALSYATMPPLVTPSGPSKAIYFWLAARAVAALGMLAVPLRLGALERSLRVATAVALAIVAIVFGLVLLAPSALPEVYVQGVGLTTTKVAFEVALMAAYAAAFVQLARRQGEREMFAALARAALWMALGEVPFALYRQVSDATNLLGHAYKVIAYVFLYRALFLETVRRPYKELEVSLRALQESEERFQQLATGIREVFWLRDAATGAILYISPGFAEVFGRPVSFVTDLDALLSAVHPDDRSMMRSALVEQLRGDRTSVDYRVVHPDGSTRSVRASSFPVRDRAGSIVRIAGVTTDVTEERRAHEALARAQRMEGMGRLAGGVAHDFNNLLTIIFTAVELASADLGPDHPVQEDLRQALEAALRAKELTTQLLAFARRRPGALRRIDLGELVRSSCAMARPILGSAIELAVLIDPGELVVRVDPGQIEQVLVNLLVNAKDAMPNGGRVVVSLQRVEPGANEDEAPPRARLRVEDTGEGMSDEVARRAFEPFFTTKGPGKGTGLGLATSFGIVTQAGGTITVASVLGKGTKMDVVLPLVEGGVDAPSRLERRDARARGGETILLVDDETAVRGFTARILRNAGYEVLVASNGAEALDVAAAYAGTIELLLSDLVMPFVGGHELATRIAVTRPATRVLFVSGYPGEHVPSEHPILAKPYTGTSLLERVRQCLDEPSGVSLPSSPPSKRDVALG